jgi:molybdate transport system substrate-binding protein
LACAASGAQAQTVVIFAAASLKNALDEIALAWKPGAQGLSLAYGASSTLARQIENGAPAQVFISADRDWMDYLAKRKLVKPETRKDLLGNALVLIAPAASRAAIEVKPGFPLAALLGNGRLAIADPQSVPAGRYAKAALESLGVWPSVQSKIAPAENVRAALALVARGEAPLGIVYRSDTFDEPKVRIVATFSASTHTPIVYPAALTASARDPGAAAFLAFLSSPVARSVFAKHGFTPLD